MSDKQSSNKQQNTSKPKPAPKTAGIEQSPAEALVSKVGQDPSGAPADLPKHGNSRALRQAQMIQMQRQHGNGYVQRLLAQRSDASPATGTGKSKSGGKVAARSAPAPARDSGPEPRLASDLLGQDLGRSGPATMAPLEPPPPPEDDGIANWRPTSTQPAEDELLVASDQPEHPDEEVARAELVAEELEESDVQSQTDGQGDKTQRPESGGFIQRDNETEGQQPATEGSTPEGGSPESGAAPGEATGSEAPAAEPTEGETTPGQTTEGGEAEQPSEGGATAEGEGGGDSGASHGAGGIEGARVDPYQVTGATLDDITGQLNQIEGYGAGTSTPLGMEGQVVPERLEDGTYRMSVPWIINDPVVFLPEWANRDQACEAAQNEWDRFMRQTRIHEQTAHLDAAHNILENLPETDRVITGASREELIENLQAKQAEIAGRIQTHHDGCDHGASIDAILHPDNGRCESEE